ncbi:DinB family protein [Pedobacter frigoris]|uniref:DinB family protein n=1 Tax=Pedobacter frigoris TaxID=2571272 RepID=UPI001CED1827|nr:DinB family protein [Pedobacter frigoris]
MRDLAKLRSEIELYRDEQKLWRTEGEIANSAGNLCLHLIGNLNTYIGAELGNTGYVRDRPLEFSLRNVPRTELLKSIDDTIDMVASTLNQLNDDRLAEEYPQLIAEEKLTTGYFLTHLSTHLAYHLGQINYHRRLLDKN